MLLKRCTQYASKFGKPSSGHRTGKRSDFIPILKKGIAQECSDYWTIMLTSHAGKVMLKTLQARLQQYEPRTSRLRIGFRKGRGIGNQINICWIIKKARELQKNIYFCFDYTKAFDCVDHNKLWKILKEMGIADNLSFLPRNHLYSGQETTVRMIHGTMG